MKYVMILLLLLVVGFNSAHAGSLSELLPGTTEEHAKIKSPDGKSVAILTFKEKHGLALPPEPPKTSARWVRLKITGGFKTIYDSSDEKLNVYQTGPFTSDLMWSPDSAHLAYRYITTLRIIGLDGKVASYSMVPEDSVIASFRWTDNENLLVVSKKERYPLDMHGKPYYYNGYIDQAKDVRIARLNVAHGFTEYYQQPVSDPTFLFHSVGFCLDEISPKADRVAFSDGANLCVYDVTVGKLTVQIKLPQKPAPKLDPKASGMEDPMIRKVTEEMASRPAQLEGVWWPTNDKLVVGMGLLGGPTKSFYVYDLSERTLTDKTEAMLPLWEGSAKAMNYQDPDWYRSMLK
jgi:hypothetical protein